MLSSFAIWSQLRQKRNMGSTMTIVLQVLLDVFTFGPLLNAITLAYISMIVDGTVFHLWPLGNSFGRSSRLTELLPWLHIKSIGRDSSVAGRSFEFTKHKLQYDYPGVVLNAWKVLSPNCCDVLCQSPTNNHECSFVSQPFAFLPSMLHSTAGKLAILRIVEE